MQRYSLSSALNEPPLMCELMRVKLEQILFCAFFSCALKLSQHISPFQWSYYLQASLQSRTVNVNGVEYG